MTAQAQIQARVSGQSVAKLQEMATLLADDFREGADYVMASILRSLEVQMVQSDFVAFCETL
jgi:hypothetical protein